MNTGKPIISYALWRQARGNVGTQSHHNRGAQAERESRPRPIFLQEQAGRARVKVTPIATQPKERHLEFWLSIGRSERI